MEVVFHAADTRGQADFGWLQAKHSFSFGRWYNPEKVQFGALRVLNDDTVQGGGGFGTHPHNNMEIVTIPLAGTIAHKDSTGGNGIIATGDVQIMSAGTGVAHSEFNASKTDTLNLLQIWILPKEENITPRYNQRSFGEARKKNEWQIVVSPDEKDNGLWINQDAVFSLLEIETGKHVPYRKKFAENGIYFFVIKGNLQVNNTSIRSKDAVGITDADVINIGANADSTLLAIEVPMYK